jgi:1-acyl-sn-glycerol-3-phosphate acyltransferase
MTASNGAKPGVGLREIARGWRWGGRTLVPASARAHELPAQPREFPTAWARRPAVRVARAALLGAIMDPMMRANLSPRSSGAEVFDDLDGPVLIVSNHASHLDAPLLLCALPREVRERTVVTAAADYFFENTWRALSTALAFGTVPIDRRGGAPSAAPVELVAAGWNLVLFPEGTRSPDGARRRFRHGAAQLAKTCGVPVVPAGLRGTFAAMPRGRSWPLPGKPGVSVRFGRPIRPGESEDVRAFTDRLSAEVDRLVAEDATTWWDSLRAAQAAGAGTAPGSGSPGEAAVPAQAPARRRGREPAPAKWRRIWAATEPAAGSGPTSPWSSRPE